MTAREYASRASASGSSGDSGAGCAAAAPPFTRVSLATKPKVARRPRRLASLQELDHGPLDSLAVGEVPARSLRHEALQLRADRLTPLVPPDDAGIHVRGATDGRGVAENLGYLLDRSSHRLGP